MNLINARNTNLFKQCILCLLLAFSWAGILGQEPSRDGKFISESWMGVYMNGIKVGYNHAFEQFQTQDGEDRIKSYNESRMKVSRLGGNPIEIVTIQESLQSEGDVPIETTLRTRMSETETVIKAMIKSDVIVFMLGEEVVEEIPYAEAFHFGVPLKKIIEEKGLFSGNKVSLKILDPIAYSLSDCQFEVMEEENVLVLGEKRKLWHVRSEIASIVPVIVDEWISSDGEVFKSVMTSGFITSVMLKMSKEMALQTSAENFDIALSSVVVSNVALPDPQKIQRMLLQVKGLPKDKNEQFTWGDGNQEIIKEKDDSFILRTNSVIFHEKDAISLPIQDKALQISLAATLFCQSDNADIEETAQEIVGEERNSWRAAKRIAEWIRMNMTPSYGVGFAKAKEILQNREGDCTEYAVLFVALCRAVGIPARAAVGIMYADGIFAYHMWPEVYVGQWVGIDARWLAVDDESGEYYTDATHIKFGHSNLDEKIFKEMIQSIAEIIGNIKLEILEYNF